MNVHYNQENMVMTRGYPSLVSVATEHILGHRTLRSYILSRGS